jgi:hypothetical protein
MFKRKELPTMPHKNCINFALTIAQHEVFLVFSNALSRFGITPGQYGVLTCLWDKETSITPKEIAQTLHVENSTISGVLDRMQKQGLVTRILNPNNRRSIRVEATEKGWQLKDPLLHEIDSLNQRLLSNLTPAERQELFRLLGRIQGVSLSS